MNQAFRRLRAIWRQNRLWPGILCVLLLLSLALSLFNQHHMTPAVESLERDYLALRERAKQARQTKAASDSPYAFFQRANADLVTFRALIPERDAFTGLVAELFRLAGKARLKITQVNYQPKELEGYDLLQYGLVFAVVGDYAQLKQFISLIEASDRLMAIEGIALRRDSRSGNQASLRLELATYFKAGGV